MPIRFQVNNKSYDLDLPPLKRLLDVLREDLRLTGSKEGCGEGECGSCSVILNGEVVNSCLVPFCQVEGSARICTSGLLMAATPFWSHAAGNWPHTRRSASHA